MRKRTRINTATKVATANSQSVTRLYNEPTTTEKIIRLYKELGQNPKSELKSLAFRTQVKALSNPNLV